MTFLHIARRGVVETDQASQAATREPLQSSGRRLERFLWLIACVLGVLALVRYEIHAFGDLRSVVRAQRQAGMELVPIPGDVSARDLPRAFKLLHGGLFEDAHYAGEVTWYPSIRPGIAALTAKLTGSGLIRAYYKSDLVLRGLALGCAFLLMGALAGGAGALVLSIALIAGWETKLDGPALYPGDSVRAPLFCFLALLSVLWSRPRAAQRWPLAYLGLGLLNGLLCLWQGSSFVVASCLSCALLVRALWLARAQRQHSVGAWSGAVCFLSAFLALSALFIAPQLLRYGHFRQPESARLWLHPMFEGGSSLDHALRLALVPRELSTLLVVPFVAALRASMPRAHLLPLAIGCVLSLLLGHLGFVVNDAQHPLLQQLARTLLRAPPATFIGAFYLLFGFAKLAGVACCAALALRKIGGSAPAAQDRRRLALASCLAFSLLLLATRQMQPIELQGVTSSLGVARFARACARILGRRTVVSDELQLIWLADLYPLFVPLPDHTNPYVQARRATAHAQLHEAIARGEYRTAQRILDAHQVGGFVEQGGPSALSRSCGAELLVPAPPGIGLALRAYRGQCSAVPPANGPH